MMKGSRPGQEGKKIKGKCSENHTLGKADPQRAVPFISRRKQTRHLVRPKRTMAISNKKS